MHDYGSVLRAGMQLLLRKNDGKRVESGMKAE